MKRVFLLAFTSIALAGSALAQTSVRPPADVNGFQLGVPCDASLGRALSTTASGSIVCTDRVANSNNATTADSATTATTATNALNAVNASNLTGTLNAAQITGQISNSALPSCPDPTKPIPTANGCVAAGGGSGGSVTCAGGPQSLSGSIYWAIASSSVNATFTGNLNSLGSGQSSSSTFTVASAGYMLAPAPSWSIPYSCGANGQFTIPAGSYGVQGSQPGYNDVYSWGAATVGNAAVACAGRSFSVNGVANYSSPWISNPSWSLSGTLPSASAGQSVTASLSGSLSSYCSPSSFSGSASATCNANGTYSVSYSGGGTPNGNVDGSCQPVSNAGGSAVYVSGTATSSPP